MIPPSPTKIHVLVLRDEIPTMRARVDQPPEDFLPNEPRVHVTISKAAYGEAVRSIRQHRPDVIVLDGVLGAPPVLVAELDEAFAGTPLLVLLDEAEREHAHDCVVAGARGCLVRPVDPNALIRTIVQVHDKAVRRRRQIEAERVGGDRAGQVTAVRGVKGGVGTTFIATNLAISIQRQTRRRVLLIDSNLFGGDVPIALNMTPNRSIADLIPHVDALDDDLLESIVVRHDSGVAVLAAPTELERAETVRPEGFQRVLEVMRTRYDHVVVDVSPFLDQNSLVALDLSDMVLVVCTPEVAALKNAARLLELGGALGYAETKMRLLLNRAKGPGAVGRADIEKHLHYLISFTIPNDATAVVRALNRGEPLVTCERGNRAAKAVDRLARTVLADRGWEGEPGRSGVGGLLRLPSLRLFPSRATMPEPNQERI
jgi:pilus assembly protein CpaE